jgi:VCBS repeat-containing protein
VLAGCNSAISKDATHLTRETLSAFEEFGTSADDGFVHVVRIAITGDNKVRVIARDEQAAAE